MHVNKLKIKIIILDFKKIYKNKIKFIPNKDKILSEMSNGQT